MDSDEGFTEFTPVGGTLPRSPLRNFTADNGFEANWAALINAVVFSQGRDGVNDTLPENWLENILAPTLGLASDVDAALNSRTESLVNITLEDFEFKLTQVSALAYAVYSQAWTSELTTSEAANFMHDVEILGVALAAHLRVNLIQLVVGFVAVVIMTVTLCAVALMSPKPDSGDIASAYGQDPSLPEVLAMHEPQRTPVKAEFPEDEESGAPECV